MWFREKQGKTRSWKDKNPVDSWSETQRMIHWYLVIGWKRKPPTDEDNLKIHYRPKHFFILILYKTLKASLSRLTYHEICMHRRSAAGEIKYLFHSVQSACDWRLWERSTVKCVQDKNSLLLKQPIQISRTTVLTH